MGLWWPVFGVLGSYFQNLVFVFRLFVCLFVCESKYKFSKCPLSMQRVHSSDTGPYIWLLKPVGPHVIWKELPARYVQCEDDLINS